MVNMLTRLNENTFRILSVLKACNNGAHIRKIAILAGFSHVTVINQIKPLEKLGAVTSEMVGRSKVFRIAKSNKLSKHLLSMTSDYEKINRMVKKSE